MIKDRTLEYVDRDFFNATLKILDIGCGKHFPHVLLFSSEGHHVIGADISYIVRQPSFRQYLTSLRHNGLNETLRYLQLDLTGKRKLYRKTLERISGKPMNVSSCLTVQGNAEDLVGIDANQFDLVISNNVFEHIHNVNKAVQEIHRVTRSDGVSAHIIHLFSSLSGGHNSEWYNFAKFPPWDHLRQAKFELPWGHLNRLRLFEYENIFSYHFRENHFEVLPSPIDASNYLSESIKEDLLSKYPDLQEKELLSELLLVVSIK